MGNRLLVALGLAVIAVLPACRSASKSASHASPLTYAVPDEGWNAAFTRTSSWNGGDIAHSIDLHDGRTLWLFGDSIYGPVVNNKRIGDQSRMLRGGIAWHPTPAHGEAPSPDSIRFAAPEPFGDTLVASWATPTPGLFPEGTWYWLMNDAVRLEEPYNQLVLFATAIGPSGNPDGMWNFRRVGGAVITIDNPDDSPERWVGTHAVNPLVTSTPAHHDSMYESDNRALAIVEWPIHSKTYYLFGTHTASDKSQRMTVAQTTGSRIQSPSQWRLFQFLTLGPKVMDLPPDPKVPDEFTVQLVHQDDRDIFVLIYSEPFANRSIWARTSLDPYGPWSDAKAIYETPDLGKGVFAYAAKGHAHLSRPGELLVSYAVNGDLGQVFNDASLYRPKFVRVPLSLLPEAPPKPKVIKSYLP